jgi:hypothetical protein
MGFEAVRIEGHLEVLALHRMLMEDKFEDIASKFAGSPFIAAIQNRLADALEAADAGSAWRNWRKAETHTDRWSRFGSTWPGPAGGGRTSITNSAQNR